MIVSLVLTGKHGIAVSEHETFKLDGNRQSTKDVPFIRYRFESYGPEEVAYIKRMQNIFKYSAHLAEVPFNENVVDTVKYLEENCTNLCKFVYITVDDAMGAMEKIPEDYEDRLYELADFTIDRYCLKDRTSAIGQKSMDSIRTSLAEIVDTAMRDIAVCSSPLSFNGDACLTAIKARELMSIYTHSDAVAVPSANHQCMECCGCIKYVVVDAPITDASTVRERATKGDKATKEPKEPKEAKAKAPSGAAWLPF